MNQLMLNPQRYAFLPVPLREIREKIEEIHDQILYAKPTAREQLDGLQHDMRIPIGNILACVTLMRMDGELTEGQEEMVDIIQQAADSIIVQLDAVLQLNG